MNDIKLNTIDEAVEDLRNGKLVIVVDDEDRENEGDFVAAAEKITTEMVNFMAWIDLRSHHRRALRGT
jgi:3,4-dihydroxy 2-butanone 4-phosphate synthase/GTP cyclohydrolase II